MQTNHPTRLQVELAERLKRWRGKQPAVRVWLVRERRGSIVTFGCEVLDVVVKKVER